MCSVLERKLTTADPMREILRGIRLLATTKLRRVLLQDEVDWQDMRFKEIARLTRILEKRKTAIIDRSRLIEEIAKAFCELRHHLDPEDCNPCIREAEALLSRLQAETTP